MTAHPQFKGIETKKTPEKKKKTEPIKRDHLKGYAVNPLCNLEDDIIDCYIDGSKVLVVLSQPAGSPSLIHHQVT